MKLPKLFKKKGMLHKKKILNKGMRRQSTQAG
jgi:hypothetical protein